MLVWYAVYVFYEHPLYRFLSTHSKLAVFFDGCGAY